MSDEPRRWVCYPDPDKVCLQGGCGYCTPGPEMTSAYKRRHYRKWTREQVCRYAERHDISISDYEIDMGMRNRAVR